MGKIQIGKKSQKTVDMGGLTVASDLAILDKPEELEEGLDNGSEKKEEVEDYPKEATEELKESVKEAPTRKNKKRLGYEQNEED